MKAGYSSCAGVKTGGSGGVVAYDLLYESACLAVLLVWNMKGKLCKFVLFSSACCDCGSLEASELLMNSEYVAPTSPSLSVQDAVDELNVVCVAGDETWRLFFIFFERLSDFSSGFCVSEDEEVENDVL